MLLGVGLLHFCGVAAPDPLADNPLLVLNMDEGSPAPSALWYLQYRIGVRAIMIRDPFHREWNDVLGGR